MPTSSIFESVVIREPKAIEAFVEMLEASDANSEWKPSGPVNPPLTDINEIRELMAKRKEPNRPADS